jgi:Fe-S cluster assembly protein SufB
MANEELLEIAESEYKYGFTTDIETDSIPKGLSEEVVRIISKKKNEPEWMLEFRLDAYRKWLTMKAPDHWAHLDYPKIDFNDIIYYSAPKAKLELASLDVKDL